MRSVESGIRQATSLEIPGSRLGVPRNDGSDGNRIMAAYGLYTHIQSNKRRSIALLIGLFFLVYVMVYAGALLAEVVIDGDALARLAICAAAWRDLVDGVALATIGTALWIVIAYFFHQSMIDAVTGGQRGDAAGAAAALQSAGEPLHLARHHDAEAQDDGERRAQRLRHRPQREAIFRSPSRTGLLERARRRRSSRPCSATS